MWERNNEEATAANEQCPIRRLCTGGQSNANSVRTWQNATGSVNARRASNSAERPPAELAAKEESDVVEAPPRGAPSQESMNMMRLGF